MTQVDRITEDIDHMPVAAFIFRDNESMEVQYTLEIRFTLQISKCKKNSHDYIIIPRDSMSPALVNHC